MRKQCIKRMIAGISALSLIAGCSFQTLTLAADEEYVTRGEVATMLLTAADDYNPTVVKSDVIKGYEDGQLHEERPVTRAEALVMLKRAFGNIPEIKGANKYLAFPKEEFTDIPQWAQSELGDIFDSGIVAGKGDGIFAPDDNVTAEEMELFIQRMYRVFGTNLRDDFYGTVNKDALDNTVIPDGESITGTLYNDITSDLLEELMKEIDAKAPEKNSEEDKIKTLYDNYLNKEARNAQGYEPIKADLDAIDSVKSISEFVDTEIDGGYISDAFFGFGVAQDSKNSNQYVNAFYTSAIHSKDMYEGKMETQKAAYLKYIKTLFTLVGESDKDAEKAANDVFALEAEIASASLSIADMYDVEKTYNEYTLDEIAALFKNADVKAAFEKTGLKNKDRFIVYDVSAMENMAKLLSDENLDALKAYVKFELIDEYSKYMSDDFAEAVYTYSAEANGVEGRRSDEYYATSFVSNTVPSYVGKIYGDKYVTDKMADDLNEMIDGIIEIYRERISKLDWMSDATKAKAEKKLDTMGKKLLKPDEWKETALDSKEIRSYADGGSLAENILTINTALKEDNYALEGKEVDKTEWITYPQEVNAFYNPACNDVNFPVAFLQIPTVYDENASYEENLGGIGYVAGHELSHAFDSAGSQYDENGNAVNWWTDEDAEAFSALCDKVVDYYDGQEGAPGVPIDAEQTLMENIADLGSLLVLTELAAKKDDFDYKEMYERYAYMWLVVLTRENAEQRASTDTHSPASVRVNRVLQSSDKFYEVYGITEKDGMWVAPEDRARIW